MLKIEAVRVRVRDCSADVRVRDYFVDVCVRVRTADKK